MLNDTPAENTFKFDFHTGDLGHHVVVAPTGRGMSFNPFALFAVDPDACLSLVQQGALFNLSADALALAKSIGLTVAQSQTPSVLSLVNAWKDEPLLADFAAAVSRAFLPTAAKLSEQLQEAEERMQDARHGGDDRALGYAEGTALRIRHELARLDEANQLLTPHK